MQVIFDPQDFHAGCQGMEQVAELNA